MFKKINKIKGLRAALLALIVCAVAIVIVFAIKAIHSQKPHETEIVAEKEELNNSRVDVWIPYWGMSAVESDMDSLAGSVDDLCYFAAYFDEDGKLFLEDSTCILHEKYLNDDGYSDKKCYLTVVNDVKLTGGESFSKDIGILKELFSSQEMMERHADDIIHLASSEKYDGIEIDYEAIKSNKELWGQFVDFERILIQKAKDSDLMVRIVLEPAFPAEEFDWPADCEYVLMCYNLYGKGTEPGPRATPQFLNEMVDKMSKMPGQINFALATGGYDFCENGEVKGVTRVEAEKLFALTPGTEPMRDEESGQLHFGYIDESDVIHYVWYADDTTISLWMDTISNRGYSDFTLFRAGAM